MSPRRKVVQLSPLERARRVAEGFDAVAGVLVCPLCLATPAMRQRSVLMRESVAEFTVGYRCQEVPAHTVVVPLVVLVDELARIRRLMGPGYR